jgi:hypothetical protein
VRIVLAPVVARFEECSELPEVEEAKRLLSKVAGRAEMVEAPETGE